MGPPAALVLVCVSLSTDVGTYSTDIGTNVTNDVAGATNVGCELTTNVGAMTTECRCRLANADVPEECRVSLSFPGPALGYKYFR